MEQSYRSNYTNLNFSVITINIHCLRATKKENNFFNWLCTNCGNNSITCTYVQEAHCDHKIIKKWNQEWPGKIYYSHGTHQ